MARGRRRDPRPRSDGRRTPSRFANIGHALSARDAFIAGAAKELGARLAVADADVDVAGRTNELEIGVV